MPDPASSDSQTVDPRWERFAAHERWVLLNLEPPDHTRIRSLVARAFTPRSVADLRPYLDGLAARLLSSLPAQFDLIAEFAQPYSIAVICELLGVPQGDGHELLAWSHDIVKMYELGAETEVQQAAEDAAGAFMEYAAELVAKRRADPDDRLLSRLATVTEDGVGLSDHEIVCTLISLLNAGHEATVNTLGNGVRALLRHPDEWASLVSGRVSAAVAVEELIRWDAPLQLFSRFVLEEGVVLGGQPLPVGAVVAVLLGSANRDPRRFPNPDHFDLGRGDPAHVGFGGGIHFCVGAPLARLELEVALAALARVTPRLTVASEPRYQPTFVLRGFDELQVRRTS